MSKVAEKLAIGFGAQHELCQSRGIAGAKDFRDEWRMRSARERLERAQPDSQIAEAQVVFLHSYQSREIEARIRELKTDKKEAMADANMILINGRNDNSAVVSLASLQTRVRDLTARIEELERLLEQSI